MQFSNHFPLIHFDFFISKYIYCNVTEIYHTCCVLFLVYVILSAMLYSLLSSCFVRQFDRTIFLNYQWSDIIIRMIIFTTYYASHLYTYGCFYICNLFHVLLYQTCILIFGGSIWQSSCILVLNSYWYSIHLCSIDYWWWCWGVHLPQYVHVTSFV